MDHAELPPIVLFEDDAITGLGPIVDTRPAFEVRVGALNLRERIELASGSVPVHAYVRAPLNSLLESVDVKSEMPARGEVLLVGARVIASVECLRRALRSLRTGEGVERGGRWCMARVDSDAVLAVLSGRGDDVLTAVDVDGLHLVHRPWEIVSRNEGLLVEDHATLARTGAPVRRIFGAKLRANAARAALLAHRDLRVPQPGEFAGAQLIDPANILVGEGVRVRPGAVIDAEDGPVILGAGVVVHPLSVVVGPAYLGPGTVVNPGAKLRAGTSIGAICKVGGEIEETVMLDFSNKQHDGFLGHALVGSWVNLGADTNGSDLKNNYGSVRVDLGDGAIDSGETFVGQHLADHVKTGIDTMLTTGGVAGVAANLFGGGFVPRFVPAFSWGGAESLQSYRFDAAIETARTVCARREVQWDERHERLLRHVHAATAHQRRALGLE
jgi:UDP-N-acetylglucosamine diphosphorylase / glucose-1-phosphate thymidylyltransferase / UDP-N-acetylgalactosamine diphosphorylase / glucosamine-1-phosphate N-acetyltransferase / galactosamine-1-phosphate N-acetyltransferase